MVDKANDGQLELPSLMKDIYKIFSEGMLNRYRSTLKRIPFQLRDEARCTTDMSVTESCVIAIEITQDKGQDMLARFEQAMIHDFISYEGKVKRGETYDKPKPAKDFNLDHLSLVGEDVLQEKIDVQTMVSNSLKECEYLLVPIHSGVGQAYTDLDGISLDIDKLSHPLSPTRIGEWLQQSLEEGGFASVARHAIYRAFQEELFDTLAPLYKNVIDIFQSQSVELAMQQAHTKSFHRDTINASPVDVGFSSPKSESRPKADTSQILPLKDQLVGGRFKFLEETVPLIRPEDDVPLIDREESDTAEAHDELSTKLLISQWLMENEVPSQITFSTEFKSVLDNNYGLSSIADDDDRTLISISAKQLNKVLGEIQQQMLVDETDWVEKLLQYIQGRTNEHELCVVNPYHEKIMRLVNHAFNLICKDFHPSVVRYLNSLRVAFVRLAITDKSFLDTGLHPAKSLFDGLTYLSYGLNPSEKRIVRQLFRTVRSFYDAGRGDAVSFEQVQYELLGFIESELQQTRSNERSSLKTLYAQKQRYLAFKTADAFINTRLKALPKVLAFHKLLHVALRHILAESYLNGGANSEDWRTATQIFSALVWISQAKANEHDQHKMLRALPKLLNKLNKFFTKHETPLEMRSLIVTQTNEIQKQILDGIDGKLLTDQLLSKTKMINYVIDKVKAETEESYREKRKLGVDNEKPAPHSKGEQTDLVPGQCLSYMVDGNMEMCKYVFHFAPLDKLVFFNWEGEKQFERDASLVKKDIQAGYARVLDSLVPLEGALRYVVKLSDQGNNNAG